MNKKLIPIISELDRVEELNNRECTENDPEKSGSLI